MIYLELFWTFLKVGLFTIGGGYAMLKLMCGEVVAHGWITEEYFWQFFAVSEATPGPVALKMSTFVGFEQAGLLGALAAILGMILPAFIIILIIAKVFTSFSENKFVKRVFWGLKPIVVALVLSAAVTVLLKVVFPELKTQTYVFDLQTNQNLWALLIFAVAFVFGRLKIKKKSPHPIMTVGISAVMGVLLYGVILQ